MNNLKITIFDNNDEIINVFKEEFIDTDINILRCDVRNLKDFDCIMSPGNSYGLMDGGIDLILEEMFEIQLRVQKIIQKDYYGEQPIGTCFLLNTYNPNIRNLAHVPTMRIPTDVSQTYNAYYAFRSLLSTILNFNKNNKGKVISIACTALCTGAGKMNYKTSAKQMRLAYENIISDKKICWDNAYKTDNLLKNSLLPQRKR